MTRVRLSGTLLKRSAPQVGKDKIAFQRVALNYLQHQKDLQNSGSVGKTPHVKMTSPWFNPSLGFAFFQKSVFWVEFLRDVFTQDGTFGQWDGETDTPCLSARDPQKPPFFSLQMGRSIDKSMPHVREFETFRMSNSDVDDEFESARYTLS